jgi:predicted membrane protein
MNNFRRFSWSLVIGALILASGVVLLLDQQGVVSADRIFQYFWPVIFIAFGLVNLFDCPSRRVWGVILLAVGVLLILDNLGYIRFSLSVIWPLIIIAIGALMIFRSIGIQGPIKFLGGPWADFLRSRSSSTDSPGGDSEFDHIAVFSGFKKRTTSKSFRGGRILALMGGFAIDLRNADIEGDTATIVAISVMGGGEIKVPAAWRVSMEGIGLMGGYVDETDQAPSAPTTPQKHLIVKGASIMGGVVVKN